MEIASHDVVVVDVPLDRPFMGMASCRHVVLRMRTGEGIEGLGWVGWFAPTMIGSLASAVDAVAADLVGRHPTHRLATMQRVRQLTDVVWWGPGISRYVEAIVEMALLDIAGKAANQSVAELLGAGGIESVPAYASQHLWRDWDLDALHQGAGQLAEAGWTAMKFRIGAEASATAEAERARAVR